MMKGCLKHNTSVPKDDLFHEVEAHRVRPIIGHKLLHVYNHKGRSKHDCSIPVSRAWHCKVTVQNVTESLWPAVQ
eukprot:scaffold288630_cov18-Tisochrysis_lutea.AAC.1